ncbi:hypothetical protein GCM10010214_20170 [Streptomyces abikoensis]|nr:hypothetical protein GCM10010214_20170 [Streptomyces abikoensis]
MLVNIGQQLGDAERGKVDEGVEMPVPQLRRYDSAHLPDARREGLELNGAVLVHSADHGCDSRKK